MIRKPQTIDPSYVALVGNPNTGKTTLFNTLTGLRMKTGNFSGTTVTRKCGALNLNDRDVELIDLPGMYNMEADSLEERVAADVLQGTNPDFPRPSAILMVMDATNLERSLYLFSQLTECELPVVVLLTMMDRAEEHGLEIDSEELNIRLGCPVLMMNGNPASNAARVKEVLSDFFAQGIESVGRPFQPPEEAVCGIGCRGCPFHGRFTWGESILTGVVKTRHSAPPALTEKLDEVLTHPVAGLAAFAAIMFIVFFGLFSVATLPMDLIEKFFGFMGGRVGVWLPEGDAQSLLVNGVIGGVGGMLVFLPQICLLFFLLALLEDSGYLSRAAFVMDRLMRRVGLPGTAFVPMLSGHACAIPAIMSARVISDARDRLATILVLPLTSCSARIPVYVLMVTLLFPQRPAMAALVLVGAYGLGIVAALGGAFLLKKTILPGESTPLLLDMPAYKRPNLKNAVLHTADKAWLFIKQAGTVILLISVGIWLLSTYPKADVPESATPREAQQMQLEYSAAGRIGQWMEPAIKPLGYDWQIGIGILSSFAAREAVISGLAVMYGLGEEAAEEPGLMVENLRRATRRDGSPVFTTATCFSLLVFYVLAMQCLPTQAVTKAETGSWKWAGFQLLFMSVLAYTSSLLVYQGLRLAGVS